MIATVIDFVGFFASAPPAQSTTPTAPSETAPLLASLGPLAAMLPWREGLMLTAPVIGTLFLRRPRR